MAIPWLPIAIGASALFGGASSMVNANQQRKINQQNLRFQREMFDKTNKYNDPSSQMARLQAAGLNPNMIYGQSSGSATGTASQPGAPDLKAPDYSGVGAALGQGIEQYTGIRAQQSGIEVNDARADNIRQDTTNKGIESVIKAINASSNQIDYRTKKRLFDTTIKTAEQRLQNLGISGQYQMNKDAREAQVTEQTVQKLGQEINNLRKQGKNLSEENIMRAIDRQLYQDYKIRPQDPIYMRVFGQIMNYFKPEMKW